MLPTELFNAAVKLPSGERAAFLEQACGSNRRLRDEIESLLEAHDAPDSFLREPVERTVAYEPITECPGTIVGPYKLLEQLGEGGFGVVYLAEQAAPVRRKVALKVLKPGMDTRQVVARFEAERQALAIMDHPNIARVFDGGATPSGRPYFVMELVKGVPVTDYCDQNRLTTRKRLELFDQVCRAVQHAHQKGVVHRDIKPSNVLVSRHDTTPVVKVIDFGIAKALGQALTDKTLFTGVAQMIGTPLYMSPEQAGMSDLDVDTRSDVYSLGVLLYELLTGTTPFDKERFKSAGYDEIRRIIREEEPPKPSTRLSTLGQAAETVSTGRGTGPRKLSRLLRGELDWVVMMALEKDRARRYETASEFAADVERYLAGEAVQAVPPSAGYRFRKFARRNRRVLATSAVLAVALLMAVGAVAASVGWVASDRAARRVRTADEVTQFLQRAEALYADNRLPEALAEVEKARGVLQVGSDDEELQRQVRQWHTDLRTAMEVEEIWLGTYDLESRDRSYADYARLFREYGIDVEALTAGDAAARIAASRISIDLVSALNHWIGLLVSDRRPRDPAVWQKLRSIARSADPDRLRRRVFAAGEAGDLQALRGLVKGLDTTRMHAQTVFAVSHFLRTAGDGERAVDFLRGAQRERPGHYVINTLLANLLAASKPPPWDEVVAYRRAAVAVRPGSDGARARLALALWRQGLRDDAVVEFREAVRLNPGATSAHIGLGNVLYDLGKHDEAITAYREAVRLDPTDAVAHRDLGLALRGQGRLDEAIAEHREAIRLRPDYAPAHSSLGAALGDKGLHDAGIAACREAIRLQPGLAKAHETLGLVFGKKGLPDDAIAAYREAIRLQPDNNLTHYNLGVALSQRNLLDDAAGAYRESIRLRPDYALAHAALGNVRYKQGKLDEAIAAYREAIRLDPGLADAHGSLGSALHARKRLDEAIGEYRETVRLDPTNVIIRSNLGAALLDTGRFDEAVTVLREAVRLKPDLDLAQRNLGSAHFRRYCRDGAKDAGELDASIAAYRAAVRLKKDDSMAYSSLGTSISFAPGRENEAIACFREAVRLDPKNAVAHDNLGICLSRLKKPEDAIACHRRSIEIDPKNVRGHELLLVNLLAVDRLGEAVAACRHAVKTADLTHAGARQQLGRQLNSVAWQLATHPDPEGRRPAEAIELAGEAVRLMPGALAPGAPRSTLGVAHFRDGNYKVAVAVLQQSVTARNGGNSVDWFFLAMAHWQLGDKAEARKWYDKSVAWMDENRVVKDVLTRLRAEAGEMLGVAVVRGAEVAPPPRPKK